MTKIPWTLADLRAGKIGAPKNGLKVFSCFACGGGSTMGYKLAGYEVLGCNEIDEEMISLYRANHSPKYSFLAPIQEFRVSDIPAELFELDVLDGSPPCSSFSMAGNREKDWSKKKMFREGQTEQVLDDLFFHLVALADRLRPKVVIAENVKGLVIGNARGYVKEIFDRFSAAGYDTQLFLLNSSRMGVPQSRERTFFVARRRDLSMPKIEMSFNEDPIMAGPAIAGVERSKPVCGCDSALPMWHKAKPGEAMSKYHPKGSFFNYSKLNPDRPAPTVTATCRIMHWSEPRLLEHNEIIRLQSFPDDYFFGQLHAAYVCGMSVPPLMMERVASAVRDQLLRPSVGAPMAESNQ